MYALRLKRIKFKSYHQGKKFMQDQLKTYGYLGSEVLEHQHRLRGLIENLMRHAVCLLCCENCVILRCNMHDHRTQCLCCLQEQLFGFALDPSGNF